MDKMMAEFSDEHQSRLIAEYEKIPHGHKGKWLADHGVNLPSFYDKRGRVLGTQPSKKKATPQASIEPSPIPFLDLDDDTRRRLIAEHDALNFKDKPAWRKAYGINSAQSLSQHRVRLKKQAATAKKKGRPTNVAIALRHETAIAEIPAVKTIPVQPRNGTPTDPTIHLPTFDDALSIIKVRRDMYNQIYSDIINDLQRMKR